MQVITHGGNFKFLSSLISLQNLPTGVKFASDITICRKVFLFNVYSGNCSLFVPGAILPVAIGAYYLWVLITLIVVAQAVLSCVCLDDWLACKGCVG